MTYGEGRWEVVVVRIRVRGRVLEVLERSRRVCWAGGPGKSSTVMVPGWAWRGEEEAWRRSRNESGLEASEGGARV